MKLFMLLMGIVLSVGNAFAGGSSSGGGDAFASDFILVGRQLVKNLLEADLSSIPDFKAAYLAGAVETTKIETQDRLYLGTREVDAINHPSEKRIELSRMRWTDYGSNIRGRFALVLHEYLGILEKDDSNYALSQKILDIIKSQLGEITGRIDPMNPVNLIVFRIDPSNSQSYAEFSFDLDKQEEFKQGAINYPVKRIIKIQKKGSVGGSSSGLYGTYHWFDIEISDENGTELGKFTYDAPWGHCIQGEGPFCEQSGEITVGGVRAKLYRNSKK